MKTVSPINTANRQILARLKSSLEGKVRLDRLILFGSRARGDFEADSDMDVLVVVHDLNAITEQDIRDCVWELGLACGVLIVPVIYSRDEWENGPDRSSLLALAVQQEGVSA